MGHRDAWVGVVSVVVDNRGCINGGVYSEREQTLVPVDVTAMKVSIIGTFLADRKHTQPNTHQRHFQATSFQKQLEDFFGKTIPWSYT
jgi:hypothetical protein